MPDICDISIACETSWSVRNDGGAADIHPARGLRDSARDALTRPPRRHPGAVRRPRSFLASHGIIGHDLLSAPQLDSLANSDLKRFRSRMP